MVRAWWFWETGPFMWGDELRREVARARSHGLWWDCIRRVLSSDVVSVGRTVWLWRGAGGQGHHHVGGWRPEPGLVGGEEDHQEALVPWH